MSTKDERYGRRMTDPGALRALAHAGRYAILERLQRRARRPPPSAPQVAGLSPSACSYHLRLLARHGFVEEADNAGGDGRERVWRAVLTAWESDLEDATDPTEAAALDRTLGQVMLANTDRKVVSWLDRSASDDREWREAAILSNSTLVATPDELIEIRAALMAAMAPYFHTNRPLSQAPPGARMLHAALRIVPGPPLDG